MKRRLLPLFVLLAMLLVPGWAAAAANEATVNLMIEGETVTPDAPPMIQNGRTLVPIRVIAEALGAAVEWDEKTRTATISRDRNTLKLQLNSTKAMQNGKTVNLDAPPAVRNQRMLLPLRFVGEALGATVGWDSTSRTVIVNETLSVHINGRQPSQGLPFYKLADKLYAPIQLLAEQVGFKGFTLKQTENAVTINSQVTVPIEQVEQELGGQVKWNKRENRVDVERLSQLSGVEQEAQSVFIRTTLPVTAASFTLQGPHRIVLDLPQAVIAEELLEELTQEADKPSEDKEAVEEMAEGTPEQSAANEEESDSEEPESDPLITGVRFSQYSASPQTVRVVIELSQKSKYNLVYTDEGIEVKLTPVPSKKGYLIVVDAGHGGKDPGARGVSGNVEKDFTLSVAKRMIQLLKQYPEFQVEATRTTDVYVTLQDRVKFANELNADLFISIHANSFTPAARGTETYYYNGYSEAFARVVHKHLRAATQFPDRGVHTAPFYVIKNTKMPAVLTETGFLSNAYENAKLTSPDFQQKVAEALVAAIREYYQSYQ
jgi:N-acetylmuramoyl-L-alanine amidase